MKVTMKDKYTESISVVLATGFKIIYEDGPKDAILAYNPDWGEFEIPFNSYCYLPINAPYKFASIKPGDKLLCGRTMKKNQAGGYTTTYGIKEYLTIDKIKSDFAASMKSDQVR